LERAGREQIRPEIRESPGRSLLMGEHSLSHLVMQEIRPENESFINKVVSTRGGKIRSTKQKESCRNGALSVFCPYSIAIFPREKNNRGRNMMR
jgi:hypothetical protein